MTFFIQIENMSFIALNRKGCVLTALSYFLLPLLTYTIKYFLFKMLRTTLIQLL